MKKKKTKLLTPTWILKGYDSEKDYNKTKGIDNKKRTGKTFKIRKCPKCDSDDVGVVVGKEKTGEWGCNKCNWKGKDINETKMNEEDFMKYLDKRGEEVS